ncbi:DNRLRE domain-containing protein [Clostridium sp. UBA4548]|uniref:DNRLRE domain-containing protein n=1 Tax=Clostridium sp. UBA4548 TaxID=1946361 RepID=UPI0025BD1A69|nr:DNRLRE domain-containing protein [Clostridium sp. UBA4548]
MKRNVLIRAICIFMIFCNLLFSSSDAIAYAAENIANQPQKGEYYGKDINKETEKVSSANQNSNKSTKALRKPSVSKPKKEKTYAKDTEVVSKRTANSMTYKLDNKTEVKDIYLDKINYKDENGNYQEIDNTLELKNDGYYENKANDYKVNFPTEITKDKGILVQNGKTSVTLFPMEGDFSRSAAAENAILYNDVFEGVDYQYTAKSNGVKEDIILNYYVDKTTFKYEISAKGVTLKEELNSIRGYEPGKKEPIFIISAPLMVDASGKINSNLTIKLDKKTFGKDIITVTVDEDWLKSPQRAYPVKIDPEISIFSGDINVACAEENAPDTNTLNNGYTYAGLDDGVASGNNDYKINGLQKTRTFVKVNRNLSAEMPKEATIKSANFQIFKYTAFSTAEREVGLYSVDESFDISRLTWNNQPKNRTFYSSAIINGTKDYISWDIKTLVNDWINGKTNNGFIL